MNRDPDDLLDFASAAAREAGEIAMRAFGAVQEEQKGDGSEVTEADRAAERHLRARIAEAFPDDAVLGEEGGETSGSSGRRWILDPIDGTRSFVSGVPLFAVLIALEDAGAVRLGCCHFPALGETLLAASGAGAWLNGAPVRVSECAEIAEARVVTSGLEYWRDWASPEGLEGWRRLVGASRFARTWGDAYGYAMVATGRADLLADPACGALWDVAPMQVILPEAGAAFTTLAGGPTHPWSTALAGSPVLHGRALALWKAAGSDAALQSETLRARAAGGG
jgi:histidinol-phosphatase